MMKKIVVSVIALFASVALSQEAVKVGARLNYQIQVPSEDLFDPGFLGFGGGIKAGVPIVDNFSFAPGLNFLYRQLGTMAQGDVDIDITEFALSIPLMLEFKPIDAFYLGAGVQLDIPFSTKLNAEGKVGGISIDESEDLDERVSIDFGIPLGVGFFINENLAIDLRAVIGITEIADEDGAGTFNQFGLGVTYFFL